MSAPATAIPATGDSHGPHPRHAVVLRYRGAYLAEAVTLDGPDTEGWQRITRDRDSAHLGRLRACDTGSAFFLERADGLNSSRHPDFRAAMNALGTRLDDAE